MYVCGKYFHARPNGNIGPLKKRFKKTKSGTLAATDYSSISDEPISIKENNSESYIKLWL